MDFKNLFRKPPILPFLNVTIVVPVNDADYPRLDEQALENRYINISKFAIQEFVSKLSKREQDYHNKNPGCINCILKPVEGKQIENIGSIHSGNTPSIILSIPPGIEYGQAAEAAITLAKNFKGQDYKFYLRTPMGLLYFCRNDGPKYVEALITNALICKLNQLTAQADQNTLDSAPEGPTKPLTTTSPAHIAKLAR